MSQDLDNDIDTYNDVSDKRFKKFIFICVYVCVYVCVWVYVHYVFAGRQKPEGIKFPGTGSCKCPMFMMRTKYRFSAKAAANVLNH